MARTTVVARQCGPFVRGGIGMDGMIGCVMILHRRPVTGMRDGMIPAVAGFRSIGGHPQSMLAERHGDRTVALHRQPQRNEHGKNGSPAVHMFSQ